MLRTERNDYRKAFRREGVSQTNRLSRVRYRANVYRPGTDDLAPPLIRRPTGKLSGRWMTYVPYDPSLETPDEGRTTDA